MSASATWMPLSAASLAMSATSTRRSRVRSASCSRTLVQERVWLRAVVAAIRPLAISVLDAALDVVEPEGLDLEPVDEVVLGDDLAVDRGRRAVVAVVPAPGGIPDEDEDGQADGEEEAEVDEAVAAITGIPAGAAAAPRDRSGSERHAREVVLLWMGRADHAGRVGGAEWYRTVSEGPAATIWSTNRSVAWPSATSNDSARKRATRSRSNSPARSQRGELVGRLEHGARNAGAVVEVEATLASYAVVVRGEERHRPAEERVLVDRAGVVGDEDVADEHQLVDVRVVGDVDRRTSAAPGRVAAPCERRGAAAAARRGPRRATLGARPGRAPRGDRALEMVSPRNVGAYRIVRFPRAAGSGPGSRASAAARALAEEHVRAGNADGRVETLQGLAERLRVERRDRARGHEAARRSWCGSRHCRTKASVCAEGLVEDAVAELLERA